MCISVYLYIHIYIYIYIYVYIYTYTYVYMFFHVAAELFWSALREGFPSPCMVFHRLSLDSIILSSMSDRTFLDFIKCHDAFSVNFDVMSLNLTHDTQMISSYIIFK